MKASATDPAEISDAAVLLELLQCIARTLREGARLGAVERGLLHVHWQVLWYLRAANRYSNTVQTLAAYLGQTKGSVSQTVQLLERRRLLRRSKDKADLRVTRLVLTSKGKKLLGEIDASTTWPNAVKALTGPELAAANKALTALLRNWQTIDSGHTFGVCRSCAFFRIETAGKFRCGVTFEPLNAFDSGQICKLHRLSG